MTSPLKNISTFTLSSMVDPDGDVIMDMEKTFSRVYKRDENNNLTALVVRNRVAPPTDDDPMEDVPQPQEKIPEELERAACLQAWAKIYGSSTDRSAIVNREMILKEIHSIKQNCITVASFAKKVFGFSLKDGEVDRDFDNFIACMSEFDRFLENHYKEKNKWVDSSTVFGLTFELYKSQFKAAHGSSYISSDIMTKGFSTVVNGRHFFAKVIEGSLHIYKPSEKLGEGSSAEVYSARDITRNDGLTTTEQTALKVAKCTAFKWTLLSERNCLSRINGTANLRNFYIETPQVIESNDLIVLVYPRKQPDLFDLASGSLSKKLRLACAKQVWNCSIFSVSNGVFHPDTKPENFVYEWVKGSDIPKLILTDAAQICFKSDQEDFSFRGLTREYACPLLQQLLEQAAKEQNAVDFAKYRSMQVLYMTASVMFCCLACLTCRPLLKSGYQDMTKEVPLNFLNGYPEKWKQVLSRLLDADLNKRLTSWNEAHDLLLGAKK